MKYKPFALSLSKGFDRLNPERKLILLQAEAISIKYASGPITTGVNSY